MRSQLSPRKLRLGSAIAAVVLFFLPWVDVNCVGRTVATQSGYQAAFATYSKTAAFDAADRLHSDVDAVVQTYDEVAPAFLIFASLICAIGSVLFLVAAFRSNGFSRAGEVLALAALVLILVQLALKLPAELELLEIEEEVTQDIGSPAVGIVLEYRVWFYLCLLALAGASWRLLRSALAPLAWLLFGERKAAD